MTEPRTNCNRMFLAWIGSLDLYEHHIKSFPKVTDFKGPNLHKFKMAAKPDFNVQ